MWHILCTHLLVNLHCQKWRIFLLKFKRFHYMNKCNFSIKLRQEFAHKMSLEDHAIKTLKQGAVILNLTSLANFETQQCISHNYIGGQWSLYECLSSVSFHVFDKSHVCWKLSHIAYIYRVSSHYELVHVSDNGSVCWRLAYTVEKHRFSPHNSLFRF